MTKSRALFGLMVIVGLFAVSVTPASAWFESTNGSTTGKGTAGPTTFSDESATVKCEKAEGEWQIKSTGKLSEQSGGPGQQLTKQGPHEDLVVKKWNECTAFGFAAAEVKPCTLQVEQPVKGSTEGTGSVVTECVVKANGNCELKVAPEAANEHLKKIEGIENVAGGDKLTANVTGITSTATATGGLGCVGVKNPKNTGGAEKGTVTNEGQKVV